MLSPRRVSGNSGQLVRWMLFTLVHLGSRLGPCRTPEDGQPGVGDPSSIRRKFTPASCSETRPCPPEVICHQRPAACRGRNAGVCHSKPHNRVWDPVDNGGTILIYIYRHAVLRSADKAGARIVRICPSRQGWRQSSRPALCKSVPRLHHSKLISSPTGRYSSTSTFTLQFTSGLLLHGGLLYLSLVSEQYSVDYSGSVFRPNRNTYCAAHEPTVRVLSEFDNQRPKVLWTGTPARENRLYSTASPHAIGR